MKRAFIAAAIVLVTRAASAQSLAVANDGSFVVAHDGVIERYASNRRDRLWRTVGVGYAGALVVGNRSAAVLDPLANQAVIVDLTRGTPTQFRTGETPIAGVFIGSDLYILERDARATERIGSDGVRASVAIAADSAFLRPVGDELLVYGRTEGAIQVITTRPFAVARTIAVAPFASDFETDGR